MEPQCGLPKTGNANGQKKPTPRTSMTTKEKLAAAEVKKPSKRDEPRDPPKSAKPKKRSLPPPGEAFQPSQSSAKKKKTRSAKESMTTKEKEKAAAVKKKAREHVQSKLTAVGGGKTGKIPKLSTYRMVMNQKPSIGKLPNSNKELSVLVRPTERTKILKKKAALVRKQVDPQAETFVSPGEALSVFRLMDLPKGVRSRIWNSCVVYPDFFIWPDDRNDREQPDLAMACRKIREEVLPIYYGCNIFGVDLASRDDSKTSLNGLLAIAKWSARLEEKGHFAMIRKLAFDYTPAMATGSSREEQEEKSLVVCVTITEEGGKWKTTAPEVHRDAFCVLPGKTEVGECITSTSPAWLNRLVLRFDEQANEVRNIRGNMVIQLAKGIQARADELANSRCQKTIESSGTDSGVEDM